MKFTSKEIGGRDLSDKLLYTGMERDARKLVLEEKLAKPEEIAIMPELEVCNLITEKYELVFAETDRVGLVKKDDAEKLSEILKLIER